MNAERAENDPDHEAEIEIEKGCKQRGHMPGLHKSFIHNGVSRSGRTVGETARLPGMACRGIARDWGDAGPVKQKKAH
jgi:hypothetical protein